MKTLAGAIVPAAVIIIGNAIPAFLFAVLLVVVFSGGSYYDWFPLRGLVSDNWDQLSWPMKILDYLWHMVLPITAMVIGGFATLTMLTKNSFLDQINQQYVLTAKAKGLTESRVLYGHVFRNAMLIVIAGFPSAFVSVLFTGALLIEALPGADAAGIRKQLVERAVESPPACRMRGAECAPSRPSATAPSSASKFTP